MTLSEQQREFAYHTLLLFDRIIHEQQREFTYGEAMRSPEQAEIYAKQGKGIADSLHCKRLAIDINLFNLGIYQTAKEDYKPLGDYWKSLSPHNRWGGDFHKKDGTPFPDSNHFERQEI
ncbi:D-alanyl-D-alanine carboxypeptidase [uncultured Caudovirales phage]|jgi:hypothetical protein|uniref:D-alanyl-D-alanine carboxypeptidase n=1 Tax=uncultured Caudovirales phage TaxID=2100421 RepID=A0A6J5KM42_9CAUD|nr:D-alanyl-D-alanine carboxypeptidase [uncultured Caudovirales phage]